MDMALPLLQRNHPSSDSRGRDLTLVNRNDCTRKTDGDTRDDSPHYQHSPILRMKDHPFRRWHRRLGWEGTHHRGGLQDRPNDPENSSENNGLPPPEPIGELGNGERAKQRTCRHRRDDGTLGSRAGLDSGEHQEGNKVNKNTERTNPNWAL